MTTVKINLVKEGKDGLKGFANILFREFYLNNLEIREVQNGENTYLSVVFPKKKVGDKEYSYYYIPNTDTWKNLSALVIDAYHNVVDGTPLSVTENPISDDDEGITDVRIKLWSGKGACVGFAKLTVNGIKFSDITLNEYEGKRWITYPERPIMKNGEVLKDERGNERSLAFFLPAKDIKSDIADFLFEQYDEQVSGADTGEETEDFE